MKAFLIFIIVFGLWFAAAWLPQFVKAWITTAKIKKAKKNADKGDLWIYE